MTPKTPVTGVTGGHFPPGQAGYAPGYAAGYGHTLHVTGYPGYDSYLSYASYVGYVGYAETSDGGTVTQNRGAISGTVR